MLEKKNKAECPAGYVHTTSFILISYFFAQPQYLEKKIHK